MKQIKKPWRVVCVFEVDAYSGENAVKRSLTKAGNLTKEAKENCRVANVLPEGPFCTMVR